MRKLLALASILFCFLSVAVTTKAEVAEFHYFPLAQGIYTPGTKFYDGDKIVILPGQIEKVKTGATYNFFVKDGNDYKEVGKGTVTGVNFWESNAKLNLNKDVDFIDDKCVVRVPVEKNRCFNTWWENGVKWEKEGVVFDAFCAFYRATVYKPGDQEVQNAYLRTGYKHYLAEANAVYKRYDYKTAYDKFVFALGFRWPGGDVSEAEQKLEKCELYIVREEEFEELRKDAKGAQKNGDHKTVIETYHRIWLRFASLFPKAPVAIKAQREMADAWKAIWDPLVQETSPMIETGKSAEAYERLMEFARYAHISGNASTKNAFTFVNNAAQNLKPGSPAFALHASLSHIASLQKAPGFFSVSDNDERSFVSDIVTGLSIAALAKAGNTLERGPHSDKVAKAFKWITETMDERGIISSSMQSTPQIFLTFGLAELYAESGDPRVRKPLGLALERLFSLQLEDGTYGRSVSGQEGIADAAIATITFRIAWDAGAPFPGNATRAFDKAHDLAMGRLKVTEGELLDSRGMPVRAGTAQEVLNYGSVLALLKSSGKQFPSGNSMKFLLHCRELKHSSNAISPEGWMLNAWMWKHFGLGQWQFLYDSIRGGIAGSVRFNPSDPSSFSYPIPRRGLSRNVRTGGVAAMHALTLMYALEAR